MSIRYTYQEVCQIISEKGHELLENEYKKTRLPLQIKCKCGVIYTKTFSDFVGGSYHCNENGKKFRNFKRKVEMKNCMRCQKEFKPASNTGKYCSMSCSSIANNASKKVSPKEIECKICKKLFYTRRKNHQLCSVKCSIEYTHTDEYKERAKINGSKGGLVSVSVQQRRGKNEIYFAQLCEQYFGKENVKTNEPMFDGWDADVIIPGIKIAIGWNGIHHFFQIGKTQSLKQVQSRDLIKQKVIEKYGYTYYTIADLGKYNPRFVQQEFELFLFMKINY